MNQVQNTGSMGGFGTLGGSILQGCSEHAYITKNNVFTCEVCCHLYLFKSSTYSLRNSWFWYIECENWVAKEKPDISKMCHCVIFREFEQCYIWFLYYVCVLRPQIPNSDYCSNGNGTLSCGQCVCDAGRYGKLCECSSGEDIEVSFRDKYENVASCRA